MDDMITGVNDNPAAETRGDASPASAAEIGGNEDAPAGNEQENSRLLRSARKDEFSAPASAAEIASGVNEDALAKTADEDGTGGDDAVPENINDYNLNELLVNENGEQQFSYSDDVLTGFSQEFKNLGLTKKQGQGIVKYFTDFEVKNFKKFTDPNELNNTLAKMFTSNEEKTKCDALINEFLSANDTKFLKNSAPNQTIVMFYKIAKGIADKYDYKENNNAAGSNFTKNKLTDTERDEQYNKIVAQMEELKSHPHKTEAAV